MLFRSNLRLSYNKKSPQKRTFFVMVARGRLTSLCFVDSALISFADRHPKVCLSFVLELSFRVQISGYPITKKSPQKRTFFVMVARGRLTSLCFVDSALISFADRHPKVCLSFVLELSFRVQISGYPITKKALKRGLFCYGSEGEIRTLDTWIMIPPL